MSVPQISVVMPVFNAAPFLRASIDSVLNQHFTDFELIIINDGSKDESQSIISSYTDQRISLLSNEGNRGLVYSLNRGLDECRAPLIARMDGDDISDPQRFSLQYEYLMKHPSVSVLATTVLLIDEQGSPLGDWKSDREHITEKQIREYMPQDNCIAHPTIMGRSAVLKSYRYRDDQPQAEDYDLWLRMLAGNEVIHKLPQPLLAHRIVKGSFTRTRQQNVFFKLARTKRHFVGTALYDGNWNRFVLKTALSSVTDLVKGCGKWIKNGLR